MPPRYEGNWWRGTFDALLEPSLVPGARILDAGSGREPVLPKARRPPGSRYVGLDLSAEELDAAPSGSYDDARVADLVEHQPDLEAQFDVIVSWQVLEHVKPLEAVFENLRTYLAPGGSLLTQFSGTFSPFGLANRVVPQRAAEVILRKAQDRSSESVFPAYYHHCWYSALERMRGSWSQWRVIPTYSGAGYFRFARPVLAAYLAYEEWVRTRRHYNLAPYYTVIAVR